MVESATMVHSKPGKESEHKDKPDLRELESKLLRVAAVPRLPARLRHFSGPRELQGEANIKILSFNMLHCSCHVIFRFWAHIWDHLGTHEIRILPDLLH